MPDAKTHYESGVTHAAAGNPQAAIAALREAVRIDPAMGPAWRLLGDMLTQTGDTQAADEAYMKYVGTGAADENLMEAAYAIIEGKFGVADRLLRTRLSANPNDVAALRLLADMYITAGRFEAAERMLERTLQLAPSFLAARHNYAMAMFRQGKPARAMPHLERLLAHDPRDPNYRTLKASCLALLGEYASAIDLYEGVLREAPDQARIWLSLGNALRYSGRRADSVRAYRTATQVEPTLGEAWWTIANLKTETLSESDIAAMRAQLATPELAVEDQYHFHFALAHALEQRGEYEDSFAHYAEGARLRRGVVTYDADNHTAFVRRAIELCTPAFFAAREGAGLAEAAPIFVLGMPRSGSTLVEQILASHSRIEGTKELPEIGDIVSELVRGVYSGKPAPYPDCLAGISIASLADIGARYIERTRIYRHTDRPFFIDKMPGNWAQVPLIHLILPNARIIDVRRHPMASCFAAFKQHFGGLPYTYDLTELGRYYNDYRDLMAHIDRVLPGRVHRIQYEDLVADTEREVRRLLEYCRVPFEPGCLRFWENDRAVGTASSEQVRSPIFRAGLEQWRNFEPWLGELKSVLGER